MKPLYPLSALLGTLVVASAFLDFQWFSDGQLWAHSIGGGTSSLNAREIEARVTGQVQAARRGANQAGLVLDAELRAWLEDRPQKEAMGELHKLTASVQKQFPRYIKLAACTLRSASLDDLLRKALEWSSQNEKCFSHYAIVARPRQAKPGFDCVIVTGQRLEDFHPGELTRGQTDFYITCPLCRRGQACEVSPLMRSVSLECPHCHRTFAMLAVDTKGHYHFVNEYLTGYSPPARFPAGISRLNEMLLIWHSVVKGVRYVLDGEDGKADNDAWQTPAETQRLGRGDCEDSSIYLADWLIARGFDARVALGHYAERGGHAWVIVRLNGRSYLLESTNPDMDTSRPPLLDEVGSRYVPDSMIDRDGFFARRNPSAPWDGDYWTEAKWQHVSQNTRATVASAHASKSR